MDHRRTFAALLIGLTALSIAACRQISEGVGVLTHSPSAEAADAPAGRYEADPDHTSVHFGVVHLDYSTFLGRFDTVEAELVFDPADPTRSRLEVVIASASVNSGSAAIDTELRDLFESAAHPRIRFTAQKARLDGASAGAVTGQLEMAGSRAPITLDVTFNGGAENPLTGRYTLGFSATGTLERSDWGLGDWRPAVADKVSVRIEAEFVRTMEQ